MEEAAIDSPFGRECDETVGWSRMSVEEERPARGDTDDREHGEHPPLRSRSTSSRFFSATAHRVRDCDKWRRWCDFSPGDIAPPTRSRGDPIARASASLRGRDRARRKRGRRDLTRGERLAGSFPREESREIPLSTRCTGNAIWEEMWNRAHRSLAPRPNLLMQPAPYLISIVVCSFLSTRIALSHIVPFCFRSSHIAAHARVAPRRQRSRIITRTAKNFSKTRRVNSRLTIITVGKSSKRIGFSPPLQKINLFFLKFQNRFVRYCLKRPVHEIAPHHLGRTYEWENKTIRIDMPKAPLLAVAPH